VAEPLLTSCAENAPAIRVFAVQFVRFSAGVQILMGFERTTVPLLWTACRVRVIEPWKGWPVKS
jgi:hypothetical protein